MKRMPLTLDQMNPFARYVHAFGIDRDTIFVDVVPYDCRCVYIVEGEGVMNLQGEAYPARPGSLFLWPAGVAYGYAPHNDRPFSALGVNFDYTMAYADITVPVPPAKAEEFDAGKLLAPVRFGDFPPFNGIVALQDVFWMRDPLLQMEREYRTRRNHFASRLRGQMLCLLCDIARTAGAGVDVQNAGIVVEDLLEYMHAHYREPLTNGTLSRVFSFHPAYLSRMMKRYTGMSLHRYLMRYRLSTALNLLQTTQLPIGCIAQETGFADSNYFSRCFKKQWGKSPGDFRP